MKELTCIERCAVNRSIKISCCDAGSGQVVAIIFKRFPSLENLSGMTRDERRNCQGHCSQDGRNDIAASAFQ
jgi:hypothetical protein